MSISPVAVFHGVDGSCDLVKSWISAIEEGIDYAAAVKCVEIGNGKNTSMFQTIEE